MPGPDPHCCCKRPDQPGKCLYCLRYPHVRVEFVRAIKGRTEWAVKLGRVLELRPGGEGRACNA